MVVRKPRIALKVALISFGLWVGANTVLWSKQAADVQACRNAATDFWSGQGAHLSPEAARQSRAIDTGFGRVGSFTVTRATCQMGYPHGWAEATVTRRGRAAVEHLQLNGKLIQSVRRDEY